MRYGICAAILVTTAVLAASGGACRNGEGGSGGGDGGGAGAGGGRGGSGSTGGAPDAAPYPDTHPLPAPVQLVSGEVGITDIAVQGGDLYWVSNVDGPTPGKVARLPAVGGPSTLLASEDARSIAVNATTLFWAVGQENAGIRRLAKTGGTSELFARLDGTDLLADEVDLYVLEAGLFRVPIARPIPQMLATAPANNGIAMNATAVFFAGCRSGGGALGIVEIAKQSGARSEIRDYCLQAVAEGAGVLYVVSGYGVGIESIQLNGAPRPLGRPATVVLLRNRTSRRLVVVPPFVYFSTDKTTLERVPVQGGEPVVVVPTGVHDRARLVSDGSRVYWVSADGTAVWSVQVE